MGQTEAKSDKAQSPGTQAGDAYRLSPELVAQLRALLDAPATSPQK